MSTPEKAYAQRPNKNEFSKRLFLYAGLIVWPCWIALTFTCISLIDEFTMLGERGVEEVPFGEAIASFAVVTIVAGGFTIQKRLFNFLVRKANAKAKPPEIDVAHWLQKGECPYGHGPLNEWSGKLRCWECGWPEK